jgi:DNA-directed RNA polymerase specialized sigma24 family protein
MNVTDMLYLYPEIDCKVSALRKEIATILEDKYQMKITSTISRAPATKSDNSDLICEILDSIDRQLIQRHEKIQELLKIKQLIDSALSELPYTEQLIIELRYFQGRSWSEVSRRTKVAIRSLHNKSSEIKKTIAQKMTKSEKK